jgi:hypothetical protein
MFLDRRSFIGAAGAAAVGASLEAKNRIYTLEPNPAGKTLMAPDGRVVFTYLALKPPDIPLASNSACCLHPVNTPSGECATDIAPSDHRFHRGLYFAWQSVDFHRKEGVLRGDFWGWGHYAPTEGRVIKNRSIQLTGSGSKSAEVAVNNDWTIDGLKVLDEATNIRVKEDKNANVLDLTFRFTSDYDVTVNQVPFSGIAMQSPKDGKGYFSNPDGTVTLANIASLAAETNWPAAAWYSYTITLNNGKTTAIAIVDHPNNPPSTWHESRIYTYLNPCITAMQSVTIPVGQPLILKYRAVTHDGEFPPGVMNALATEFRR